MQKAFKILGIFALVAAIGFSMAACKGDSDDNYSDPPRQFIEVTGIPSAYSNMVGALRLKSSGVDTAYSTEEKIDVNSTIFPLFNWANERPWEGSGDFSITIYIFQNIEAAGNGQVYARRIIDNTSISEGTTTIAWSSFTP